jgi:hypothetical protein
MPITVTCPTCQRTFRVADEYAGRRGLCPGCRAVVEVPDADFEPLAPVDEEPDYDDRPRRPRREPQRPPSALDHLPAWRRVGLGYLIQQLAAALILLALALVVAAAVVLPDDPLDFDRQPTPAEVIAWAVGACAALFGVLLQLTGRFVSAPTPVRAPRAVGWLSAILTGLQFPAGCMVGCFAAVAGADQQQPGGQPDPVAAMLLGLGVFGWLVLVLAAEACHGFAVGSVGRVLRADVARALGRGLGVYVMVAGFLAIVCLCGFGAWSDANNPNGQNPAAVRQENQLALGWLVGAAVLTGLYLMLDVVLLQQAKAAIARIGEPEEPGPSADDGR